MPKMLGRRWIFLALMAGLLTLCSASIYSVSHSFDNPDVWVYAEGGMYAGRDPDNPEKGGKGEIIVDLQFTRSKSKESGTIQMVMFRPEQERMIGHVYPDSKNKAYCCTADVQDQDIPECTKDNLGKLIKKQPRTFNSNPLGLFGLFVEPIDPVDITFAAGDEQAQYNETFVIHRTGIYQVLVASCDANVGEASVAGGITFKNPYGYLPGQLYGYMPFYFILMIAYGVLAFLWLIRCVVKRAQLLPLHGYVSVLLLLGLIEAAVNNFTYKSLNKSGTPVCCPLALGIIAADILSVMKTVPSKVLVLLVCMGWGIVSPSVEKGKRKWVVYIGLIAFALSILHELAVSASHNETVPSLVKVFVSLPMYLVDLLFLFWIFAELRSTKHKLQDRGATEKYQLYRRFQATLYCFLTGILAWGIYAVIAALRTSRAERWRFMNWKVYFLVGGIPPGGVIWDMLYFSLLVIVMILFIPGEASAMYAYRPEDDFQPNIGLTAFEDFGQDSSDEDGF